MTRANNVVAILPRPYGVRFQKHLGKYGVRARGDRDETFHDTFHEAMVEYRLRSGTHIRKMRGASGG